MNIKEFKREKRVEELAALIKEAKTSGDNFKRKDLILAIMNKYNVSQRTATEYYEQANFKNEHN